MFNKTLNEISEIYYFKDKIKKTRHNKRTTRKKEKKKHPPPKKKSPDGTWILNPDYLGTCPLL